MEAITLKPGNYDLAIDISLPFWVEYVPFVGGWGTINPLDVKKAAETVFPPLGVTLNAMDAPSMFSDTYEFYITAENEVDVNELARQLRDYLKDRINKYIKVTPKEAFELTPEQIEKKAKENFLRGLGDFVKKIAFIGALGLVVALAWSPPIKALFQVKEKKS